MICQWIVMYGTQCSQRYMPKLINIAALKHCCVNDVDDLQQVHIDIKAIVSFHNGP